MLRLVQFLVVEFQQFVFVEFVELIEQLFIIEFLIGIVEQ